MVKGGLVRGHDKPIHGSVAIYFPVGIFVNAISNSSFRGGDPYRTGQLHLQHFCSRGCLAVCWCLYGHGGISILDELPSWGTNISPGKEILKMSFLFRKGGYVSSLEKYMSYPRRSCNSLPELHWLLRPPLTN